MSSPGIDEWNKRIEKNIKELDDEIKKKSDPHQDEASYHLYKPVIPLLEDQKKRWEGLKADDKVTVLGPSKEELDEDKMIAAWSETCRKLKPKYDAVLAFYRAHKKDKYKDLLNPPPPVVDYYCFSCRPGAKDERYRNDTAYAKAFMEPEAGLFRQAADIAKFLEQINYTGVWNSSDAVMSSIFRHSKDPNKEGACGYLFQEDIGEMMRFLVSRLHLRAFKLAEDNKKNPGAASAIAQTLLTATRESTLLLGSNLHEDDEELALIRDEYIGKTLDKHLDTLVAHHQWQELGNIPFIYSMIRQYALLGGDEWPNLKMLFKLLNSFRINLELDVEAGKKDARFHAHLKGSARIMPEFYEGTDSCYAWVVCDDAEGPFVPPKKKPSQEIKLSLLTNELISEVNGRYAGTYIYHCFLKSLHLNYCHDGGDSIFLSPITPDPNMAAGTWFYPNTGSVPGGIYNLDMTYFRNLDQVASSAKSGELERGAEDFREKSQATLDLAKKVAAEMKRGGDPRKQADYQKLMEQMNQFRAGQNRAMEQAMAIGFPLVEKQTLTRTLFRKRFDAKEINAGTKLEDLIVYGYYTVEIVYDPPKE
jgi:hypothetical protein